MDILAKHTSKIAYANHSKPLLMNFSLLTNIITRQGENTGIRKDIVAYLRLAQCNFVNKLRSPSSTKNLLLCVTDMLARVQIHDWSGTGTLRCRYYVVG
jgi:hypothetical protein